MAHVSPKLRKTNLLGASITSGNDSTVDILEPKGIYPNFEKQIIGNFITNNELVVGVFD